ncbi:MAG: histidine kinase [Variovorax sp.]|nr:histidine kinase [Variovorax sp.]
MTSALRAFHGGGLIHKALRPESFPVDVPAGRAWLVGFGFASAMPREQSAPDTGDLSIGALRYMAPEQTGRTNRSVDSRSDLYALGATLYQMLVGVAPFSTLDPAELMHCHLAQLPIAPARRLPAVPAALSALVMKLLAKPPEDRYQTAAGVHSDLQRCLTSLNREGRVVPIALGAADASGRLQVSERLYGRQPEVAALSSAFDRMASGSGSELVLISGCAGVGKSSVVREFHATLGASKALFASGKFDQYSRDTPYATLAQAMRGLANMVLGRPENELDRWRSALREAVGPHGQLVSVLIPELELLIGAQPRLQELPLVDAQSRFHGIFARLLQVFARQSHPLVLFLDDLQWVDPATLRFLEHFLSEKSAVEHLLLIGAFRENEVGTEHPLKRMLDALRLPADRLSLVSLQPLGVTDVGRLVADTLRCTTDRAAALAKLIHKKTDGNPFFAAQFIGELCEEGLLAFDAQTLAWTWSMSPIEGKGSASNVVELMISRLVRLPAGTRLALRNLACFGVRAPIEELALACRLETAALRIALRPAVANGLLLALDPDCAFVHDRVREAAYALVPQEERAGVHLAIARLLMQRAGAGNRVAGVFAIAEHLNRGGVLVESRNDRDHAASINLAAARSAMVSAAHASAAAFALSGLAFLDEGLWQRCNGLAAQLQLVRAECEFLSGRVEFATDLLNELLVHAESTADRAAGYRLLVVLHSLGSDYAQAIACASECLLMFGITLVPHPDENELARAFDEAISALDARGIDSLIDLPEANNPAIEAAMSVLSELHAPACFTDERLAVVVFCQMVKLNLQYGLTPASAQGFAWFGIMLGHHSGRWLEGQRLAALSRALVERHRYTAYEAKSLFSLEISSVWTQPLEQVIALSRAAFKAGAERGDMTAACFACHHTVNDMLVRGDKLEDVEREIEDGLLFVRRAGFRDVVDELVTQQRFVISLRGRTASTSEWDGQEFDRCHFESQLTAGRMPTMIFWYWLMRAQSLFIAGDIDAAGAALRRADDWTWSSPVHVQYLNYVFFLALTQAAQAAMATRAALPAEDPTPERMERIRKCRAQLAAWQDNFAETFADKVALVDAEIARLEERTADAGRLYERAIGLARLYGFTQNEALANELAARFHAGQGLVTAAEAYLRNARLAYQRWGALGKVREMDEHSPPLRPDVAASRPRMNAASDETSMARLDLSTVARVSQLLSSGLASDRLIDALLTAATENAGAQRGLLILWSGESWRVEAEARMGEAGVSVAIRPTALTEQEMPESLLHFVVRTQQHVLIDDAALPNPFDKDAYWTRRPVRSVLCLPLLRQANLVGVLYLENNLAPQVFTPRRFAVLEVLSSQAAISLENARVQAALQESELRFRQLADATQDVIWITEVNPERVVYASPGFERVWGFKVQELYRDPNAWIKGMHPLDRERVGREFGRWLETGGAAQWVCEFRVVHLDGTVRWMHDRGVATSGGDVRRVSGITTDVTEQRLAEAALRESEERFVLAVAGSKDGIWDWDILSGRMFMSERAQHLYGLQAGPATRTRKEWRETIRLHPEDAENQVRALDDYLAGKMPAYEGEWRIRQDDGSYRWVRVRGLCERDPSGRATRMAGSISDVDSQRRTEAALQQAQRMEAVGTLASGMAHDFNNILGAILGFGEMAVRSSRAGSRMRRNVELILKAGERGRSLVEKILAFSRTGVGERVPVHVETVVQDAVALLRASLPANVRLVSRLEAGGAAVMGDSTQVHQVVMNLGINAIQAMPDGGSLEVRLAVRSFAAPFVAATGTLLPGEYLALTVRDTGAGIPREIISRIFDPFFTTKDVGAGTGLGLSLVHGIVAGFGGAIEIMTAVGGGSVFTVYMPRLGSVTATPAVRRRAMPRGSHEQILVVDDEESLVRLTSDMLNDLGYVVVGFTSPLEALAAFRAHPDRFDAMVTDERMPGMTGEMLIRAVRAIHPAIPVLLVSGYLSDESVERARLSGAGAVLRKPLAMMELAKALALALKSGTPPLPSP